MQKNVLTRIFSVLLIGLLLISCMQTVALTSLSNEATQDGVEVTLFTDKSDYTEDESITSTLTVKNTNTYAISNVSLNNCIPDGYALADGNTAVMQVDVLGAGETVTLTVQFVPGKNTVIIPDPSTPSEDVPKTGDSSNLSLWMLLMAISVIGLVILAVKNRAWKRQLSMVLAFAVFATMIPALTLQAAASELNSKTINVSTTVQVEDEPVLLNATVTYDLPTYGETDTHTVKFILNYEGAPEIPVRAVAHGDCVAQPEGIVREGYTFAYWFKNEADGVEMFDLSQPVTEDITLYAYWIEGDGSSDITFSAFYKVSFDYPDGMTEDERIALYLPEEQTVYENALIYSLDEPLMEGYVFAAWFYDSAMTQMAEADDVITGDTVLYPLMVKNTTDTEGMPTNNYVAALDVTDLNYEVTVKAPDLQSVKDGLIWLDIAEGGQLVDITVTDNGDGTYTVRTVEALEPGKTYQLRVQDREQIPATGVLVNALDSYIRFYHNGELQSIDIEYYNVFTVAQEVDNLRLNNGIVLIPISQVTGIDLEETVGLISLMPDENGEMSMTENEQSGSFGYTGDKLLQVGDVALIYEGDISTVESEYANNGTVGAATNSTFVKISSVQGDTYHYGTPELNEVLFMPDVLPIHMAEDTDGNGEDNSITVADNCLDFGILPIESASLDENTVAEPGDFIAFYDGTLEEPGNIRYAKILTVDSKDGFTTITFESATMEDIQTSIDSYICIQADVEFTEQEQILLENKVVQQTLDSGFAEEAAALAVQQKLGLDEDVVWGQQYSMTRQMAQTLSADLGPEVDIEDFEIDAGMFLIELQMDPPDVNANITSKLQRITTINNGKGIRVAFGVYIPVGIEIVNAFTQEVDQSLKMDLYVTMEQEFAFDIILKADYGIDFEWIIWESDAWLEMDISFDIGTYTGVGAVIMVDTEKNYEKSYLWDELVEDDGSGGAFTSAESLADQLDEILSEGDSSFFNQYKDESGNSTLIDEYRQMLQNDVDYIDILAIPLVKYKNKITPTTPIGDYKLSLELVFAAKVNVVMGTSFQTMNVKRYSFSIRASVQDGVDVWANPVVDKQTPYHSLNLMLMGNIGLRAGFRFTGQIGLLDVRIANVGIMVEIGAYVDLYGFGYFHYDWSESGETNSQQAGALYVDIGMYMDIDLSLNALMDYVTATFHVLEMEVSFFRLGTRQYLVDVKPRELTVTVSQKNRYDNNRFTLGSDAYRIQYVDIVNGDISYCIGLPNNFVFQIPDEYADKIVYQRTDIYGNVKHQFYVKNTVDELELEIPVRIVYKASMNTARGNSLDSIYDLIGEAAGTKTIQWSRGKSKYSVSYYNGIPYNYYDANGKQSGGEYITIAELSEMSPIPSISINHLAPEVPGMDFAGWEVTSYDDEHSLSGMIIEDFTDLAGQEMISGRIYLHAVYTPRDDTKYTVRHLIPSLSDPDDYEVFVQEEYVGTTHSGMDPLDYILTDVSGISMDYSRLAFTAFEYFEVDGVQYLFYSFRHSIRNDGRTVVDIYYKRDACRVTVFANNPLYVYYGDTTSSGVTSLVKYGEAVEDPGYADADIPGFTFLGWSTTKDGSSGIMESLPESLDFTAEQEKNGIAYYAVWEAEQVDCTINYYLQDPQGEYQFLGTESQKIVCGTLLAGYNLKPQNIQLPNITYGGHIEAYTDVPFVGKYITYNTEGYVINVYYDQSYYKVVFGQEVQYYLLGDVVTFPSAEKEGYVFQGWESWYVGDTNLYLPGDTFKLTTTPYYFYPVFTEADDVKYTVKHYLEKVNGTYSEEADLTETFFDGTTDGTISPDVKSYTGFDSPVKQTVTVAADGSTVVEYFYERTTYGVSVDFQVDGENLILRGQYTLSYKYGVPFNLSDSGYNPITINRTGYELVGWYWADDPNQTLLNEDFWVEGEALISDKDLVFKPLWEKSVCSYTVEHYAEQLDGTYTLYKTENCEGEFQLTVTAQVSVLNGFTFDEDSADNVLSGCVAADGSLVLKLYYTRNSYQANWYDYDGSTLLSTTRFKFGETVTAPAITANRTGYTFGGWDIGTVTMPVDGLSFNAQDNGIWISNTYTVSFNANGGTGTIATQTMTYDETQSLSANTFTRVGYTFAGWSLTVNGDVMYTDQAQVSNLASSGTVALYAQWTVGTATAYKVEYYGEALNGTGYEVIRSEDYTGVTGADVTVNPIDIAGFTFEEANSDNVVSGEIAGDGTLVLKLYYTRNSYTLTLDFNGESMKQAVRNEETWKIEVLNYEIEDITYTLKYGQSVSDVDFDAITMTVKTGEQVYDENTGEWVYETKEVSYKEAFAGYVFAEWDGLCNTMPVNDLTLTAQWTPVVVTITLKPGYNQAGNGVDNEPTGEPITITGNYGETIGIPANHGFECEGYFIVGWNYVEGITVGPEIVEEVVLLDGYYGIYNPDVIVSDGAEEMTPYWANDNNQCTVEFDSNGGIGVMDAQIVTNTSGIIVAVKKNLFTKEGYRFIGWLTPDGYICEDGDMIGFTGSKVKLVAQWEESEE